ncbi:MAG: hydrogenase/urease maturation nickel metallochaperone HypA [Gemmatimonadaceae bacterium]|nr:hydrogenase/urease maturation nickel metallochaperone HypA [Gemmatimonadaceae bacterium]
MHELSLAMEVCRVLEGQLSITQQTQLVTVSLEVGTDATVEIANLQFCLDALLSQPPFRGATVRLTPVAGEDLRVAYLELDDERTAPVGAGGGEYGGPTD